MKNETERAAVFTPEQEQRIRELLAEEKQRTAQAAAADPAQFLAALGLSASAPDAPGIPNAAELED